ncbi:tetratricopeptide repeat protein [Corynebacterium heidelbergense]|uniref:Co-chaperone YbbN n=1 Tax=Corynebacterium heidelbergense TaxID=2055947 RepID=A0A364V7E6_9CORY|nr:tetratricopeptide repeat protein [Corynebacterium heidelbergense]RAV32559.1 co-chaperone YbbN [Corynebacterium heidelbergense]
MTNPKQASGAQPGPRFVAGAVDLGELKQRSQRAGQSGPAQPERGATQGGGEAVQAAAQITPETFEQDLVVRSTQVAVIVHLGSPRSLGSEEMREAFTALAEQQGQAQDQWRWVYRHVNVDTDPEVAQAFGVQAVPTVLALAAGRPLTSFEGTQPSEQLSGWVDAIVQATDGKLGGIPAGQGQPEEPEQQDPRLVDAEAKIAAGDYPGAVDAYDAILKQEPGASEVAATARSARANALLLQRVEQPGTASAEEALAALRDNPADAQAAEVAADHLLLSGQKAAAFDALIGVIQADAGEQRSRARARLLELFELFDAADPEVAAARTKMASALF